MELFKHSCPFCGQHIEYTVEYCGRQMVCPSCQKNVTFPAVPPRGKGQTVKINRRVIQKPKVTRDFKGLLVFIREFEHWNIVGACLIPFGIIIALLLGASALKHHLGEGPAAPTIETVHADANAWQKMTDVARADQVVQQKLAAVIEARAAAIAAQQTAASRHAFYQAHPPDSISSSSVALQLRTVDQGAANAHAAFDRASQAFEAACQTYQKLGGTVDYHQQLPR